MMQEAAQAVIVFFETLIGSIKGISVNQIILTVIALAFFTAVTRIVYHAISSPFLASRLGRDNVASLKKFTGFFLYTALAGIILEIFGFSFSGIINFRIIETEKVTLSIYHLLILVLIIFTTRITIYAIEIIIVSRTGSDRAAAGRGMSLLQIIRYVIYVVAFSVFIESLGFSITFLIASISALLVGLGLGIQHLFDDLISGIILLFDGSIKIDDVIEIEGKIIGRVTNIGLRTTEIMTRDSVVMIIPNSSFTSGKIINWSHNREHTRFSLSVGIAYGSDVRQAEKIMVQCAGADPSVASEPAPFVVFENFGESSLELLLMFCTSESFYVQEIRSRIRFRIYEEFRKAGITIPFNQMDIYIR